MVNDTITAGNISSEEAQETGTDRYMFINRAGRGWWWAVLVGRGVRNKFQNYIQTDWKFGIDMYTPLYLKQITS